MAEDPKYSDNDLLKLVKANDHPAFRKLFDRYYKYLVVTSYNVLGDPEKSKDAAQEVFLELWKKRDKINISSSLKSYLRRAVINKTLNMIKAQRFDFKEPETFASTVSKTASAQQNLEKSDLEAIINTAIENLPKKCRMIFVLCRFEHLSHKEIAAKLGISTKTVENQMTKALKTLRIAIEPYMAKTVLWLVLTIICWL